MGKKLANTVYVRGDQGQITRYGPGTPYTSKLGKAITNESAWVEDEPESVVEETEPPAGGTDESGDQTPPAGGTENTPPPVEAPPRAGAGSGRDAWAEFAKDKDVQVPEGATRDDIIAFLEEREIIAPAEQA